MPSTWAWAWAWELLGLMEPERAGHTEPLDEAKALNVAHVICSGSLGSSDQREKHTAWTPEQTPLEEAWTWPGQAALQPECKSRGHKALVWAVFLQNHCSSS